MRSLADWSVSGGGADADAAGWEFRTRLAEPPPAPDEEVVLRFGGLATVCDVYLNESLILSSTSMYATSTVDVGRLLTGDDELVVRVRPLDLATPRKPRARWRPAIVPGGLRFHRTTFLGRAPGLMAGPPPVGPWRPVTVERRKGFAVDRLRLRAGSDGLVEVDAEIRSLAGPLPEVEVEVGGVRGPLGRLRVPDAERWWPHTHGTPVLYPVTLRVGDAAVDAGRVGFRTIEGLPLRVNGVPVFARGAIWTPDAAPRASLERMRDAGMNMVRVAGTTAYETEEFHDLCDELGILVWQDLMFANLDYPFADPEFHATVVAEATGVFARIAAHPSTAVVCGNSEVEQQAAMLGVTVPRAEFFATEAPELLAASGSDAVYVPSAPYGGALPFHPGEGVDSYFGVGGYRRPLSDVRMSGVRFAAECLAFANLPDDGDTTPPRDAGADWDFGDVRDHYLRERYPYATEAAARQVTGEVMADVFGEWRRAASGCGGGLVLWWRDLVPGAGWGLLDARGRPKVAYWHVARALAPVAVWLVGEGLGGIDVHVANDRGTPLRTALRVALYRDFETLAETATTDVEVAPHSVLRLGVEEVLGHFADVSYAYRFGPPTYSLVVADIGSSLAVALPLGPPPVEADLGLRAVQRGGEVVVTTRRYAHGVRLHVDGGEPADDAFPLEPGGTRAVAVTGTVREVSAVNLDGRVPVA
jgi:beta-mannosidase